MLEPMIDILNKSFQKGGFSLESLLICVYSAASPMVTLTTHFISERVLVLLLMEAVIGLMSNMPLNYSLNASFTFTNPAGLRL